MHAPLSLRHLCLLRSVNAFHGLGKRTPAYIGSDRGAKTGFSGERRASQRAEVRIPASEELSPLASVGGFPVYFPQRLQILACPGGIKLTIRCAFLSGCSSAPQNRRFYSTSDSAPDYYSILGVSKTASQDEIKKAYRQTALKWHPDRNPHNRDEAGKRFREASEAYQILADAKKRAEYDASLNARSFRRPSNPHEYSGDPFASRAGGGGIRFGNLTPDEAELLFRRAFGGISLDEIFRQAFQQQGARSRARGFPYQHQDAFEYRMSSRPSTSFLDDREIYEILRGFSGGGPEVSTQVSYHTRGGRIIERRTTVRRFPGGSMQTETTERDIGSDMSKQGSDSFNATRGATHSEQPRSFFDERLRATPQNRWPKNQGMGPASPTQHLLLVLRESAKHLWRLIKLTALRTFARAFVQWVTKFLMRRR